MTKTKAIFLGLFFLFQSTATLAEAKTSALLVIFKKPLTCAEAHQTFQTAEVEVLCKNKDSESAQKNRRTYQVKYSGKLSVDKAIAAYRNSNSLIEHIEVDEPCYAQSN